MKLIFIVPFFLCVILLLEAHSSYCDAAEIQPIPRNISGLYRGDWVRKQGTQLKSAHGHMGMLIMNYKSAISDTYHTIKGELVIRDGVYSGDNDYHYVVRGMYAWKTGLLHLIAVPPGSTLDNVQDVFGDNFGNLFTDDEQRRVFQLEMSQQRFSIRNRMPRELVSTCIYKGVFSVHQAPAKIGDLYDDVDYEDAAAAATPIPTATSTPSSAPTVSPPPVFNPPVEISLQSAVSELAYRTLDLQMLSPLLSTQNTHASMESIRDWTALLLETAEETDDADEELRSASRRVLLQLHQQQQLQPQQQKPVQPVIDEEPPLARKMNVTIIGEFEALNCNSSLSISPSTYAFNTVYEKGLRYTTLIILLAFFQTLALIYQMNYTSTQSGASRVSLLTVGTQAMLDSYLCLLHLTKGVLLEPVFNAFAMAAFMKFVMFSVFEMRYLLSIWKARRSSQFNDSFAAMRRELSMLYTRFYGFLLGGMILMYQVSAILPYFVFALYSFWVPQIYCNASRNARRSVHPLYVITISLTRLIIPLYFFGCPVNFLAIKPNMTLVIILIVWTALQATVLILQHIFGPRFFVPNFMLPPKYDYRRPLPASLIEHGEVNCVVCMCPVTNEPREYMITPCDHVFHSGCLERWMDIKMECPTCRTALPES